LFVVGSRSEDLPIPKQNSSLEDIMNLSQTLDQAANSLEKVDWNTVAKELIELWTLLFKGFIVLVVITKVAGETLGNLVHRTNDILAANWVWMLGFSTIPVMEEEENEEDEFPLQTTPSTPAEAGQNPLPVITEEVSVHTPPTVEVEPMLPPVAEVVEIPVLDEQPPPPARRRRSRNSASNALEETVTEEAEPATNRRPRGPKAHGKRVRRTLAA
jgi:hypothetical protein